MRGEIDDIHRSAATGFGAGQMLMLERLHESMMGLPFLLCFHDVSLKLLSSSFLGGWVVLAQLRALREHRDKTTQPPHIPHAPLIWMFAPFT